MTCRPLLLLLRCSSAVIYTAANFPGENSRYASPLSFRSTKIIYLQTRSKYSYEWAVELLRNKITMGASSLAHALCATAFAAHDITPTSADKLMKKLESTTNSAIRDGQGVSAKAGRRGAGARTCK